MSSSFPAVPADTASRGEAPGTDTTPSARTQERMLDGELVKRARAGDSNAWGRLYQNHFDRVYRYALFLVGEGDLAEELTQETFARALVSLRKFRGDSSVQTWLNRIAVNVAREHWRSQRRRGRIAARMVEVAEMNDGGEVLHEDYLNAQRSKVLYAVLDELAPQLREAFVLRDLMGHSVKDAAEELGISAGNLAVRAHRARRKVEAQLGALGWLDASDTGEEG